MGLPFLDKLKKNKMFKLGNKGGQSLCLGLDIGSHAIKVCVLEGNGESFQVKSLGSAILPQGCVEDGILREPDTVKGIIQTLIKNLKIKQKKAAISISGYSVIVKKINLEVMSDEDLETHIQSEAEQYIPFDIDDVYLDFQNLKTNTEDEDRTDVMLVAAKKEVVDGYLSMLKSAGLTTVIVDVDAFSLENAYESNYELDKNIVLVDIGASKMNINIISQGTSILARDVVLGSRQLTEQIQSRFELSFEEAESLKIGESEMGDKKDALEDIFVSTSIQWVTEIKRALDFYYSNYPDETIYRLVLSGGGARIRGLDEFFKAETGISVEIFNPFKNSKIDEKSIDPEYIKFISPEMAISAGLATRPIEW
jgi:type IV pilus assembly protein PilM